MIEIDRVSHGFGRSPVLRDVSLRIPKGGITALIGPNGAGKSTLLSLMARLIPLQAGRIAFDGLDVSRTPSNELALKLAVLRQDTAIATRLTVRDLVTFGRYPRSGGRPGPEDHAAVGRALAEFDLGSLAGRFLDELSGGQRQRAFVAMTFAQAADYLLLDEPLNSLDLTYARALMHRLRSLADDHGRTVVVVLHDINYAAAWADRIVALREGAVVAEGTPAEVIRPDHLRSIYGVRISVIRHGDAPLALHHLADPG
ncbi:MAG TPA: ATP-binding cassette domain-containing protein [Amaricoccus sp.]|uniref:iron ABC transporter ATP-binding protein n=1 Tax=Amaricoccus sp. TaxID=1872485 RepID=UPI002C5A720C|nr:ATP-binding cassette domain-containing protein [Amaricoccus sp.]HMQ92283.1 ATP-binding cassette domain-containing protein [Amaricoccus sp.]HMR51050.1 ATP-binding cassette domain-containing protein [Amaricoccus sp.]HMR60749.1 ATP-binding cassette domain-containing protein [Amaricoccus sp.]HMT97771.1 ATP-binding cassette domain-containing protein [Amaricoccus sp.]